MTTPHSVQEMSSRGFLVLLICFGLVVALAIVGAIMAHYFGPEVMDLFRDAMRIIGIGGPTGTATNAAADAVKTWRANAPVTPPEPAAPWKAT